MALQCTRCAAQLTEEAGFCHRCGLPATGAGGQSAAANDHGVAIAGQGNSVVYQSGASWDNRVPIEQHEVYEKPVPRWLQVCAALATVAPVVGGFAASAIPGFSWSGGAPVVACVVHVVFVLGASLLVSVIRARTDGISVFPPAGSVIALLKTDEKTRAIRRVSLNISCRFCADPGRPGTMRVTRIAGVLMYQCNRNRENHLTRFDPTPV